MDGGWKIGFGIVAAAIIVMAVFQFVVGWNILSVLYDIVAGMLFAAT